MYSWYYYILYLFLSHANELDSITFWLYYCGEYNYNNITACLTIVIFYGTIDDVYLDLL